MCAISDTYNYSFKWVIYLVIITGIFTFLHWFLAVPLLYFHFYECCNDKWTGNWVMWFLVASLGCWIGLFLMILFVWCFLRLFSARHLNESNVHLTDKKQGKYSDVTINEKTMVADDEKNFDKPAEPEEIVVLPDFNPKGNLTILQINDVQPENSAPETNLEIPADENRVHIQNEIVKTEKTPREIFFRDLIEGASDSYFGFDPDKISEFVKTKYEKPDADEKNFFLAYHENNENLTSEVMVTLNEKGLVEDEFAPAGQFQILKN